MNEIYERLAKLCADRGEKPAAVCRKVGLATSLPTELKMGRKKGINLITAGKLSAYLGVPVGTLLGTDDPAPEPVAPAPASTQPSTPIPAYVQNYNKLDPIDQAKVEAYIAGLMSADKYSKGV